MDLGDPITPGPLSIETPFLLGAGSLSWRVYPVETTVAEKLHALLVRHSDNSRSKDIFDLNLLLPKCNPQILNNALAATFQYRKDPTPKNILDHIKKTDLTLLKKGWASATSSIREPHDFDETFNKLIENLSVIF